MFDNSKFGLLKYYDFSLNKISTENTTQNIFIIAGEHPREMISVETLFNFLKYLCQNKTLTKKILNKANMRFVVNANPNGRTKVENGEYCRRKNLNEVDINRNWNYSFNMKIALEEEYPGKEPFSEIETQFIYRILEKFKAKMYLTIHSGFFGLFIPYAFHKKECELNNDKMKQALNIIKTKYCSICKLGAPSKLIGYKSSGTGLDYTYEKMKIPYTFAWEIYTNEEKLPEIETLTKSIPRFLQRHSYKKTTNTNMRALIKDLLFNEKRVKFSTFENQICLELFNPVKKDIYDNTLKNWANALVDLISFVIEN